MYLLSILAVLGLNGWVIVSTHRRLSRGDFGRAWHVASLLLTCAGLTLGVWFSSVRYLASSTSKVYGVPFCIAGADFIDGRWLAGGVGRFMPLPMLADVSLGIAVCLSPITVCSFLHERRAARALLRREGGGDVRGELALDPEPYARVEDP